MDTVDIIFNLLKQQKKSQQEFADAIGVPKYKVSEWKSRKTATYKNYLTEIASFFSVTTDYLLGKKQKNKSPKTLGDLNAAEIDLILKLREGPKEVSDAVFRAGGVTPPDRK